MNTNIEWTLSLSILFNRDALAHECIILVEFGFKHKASMLCLIIWRQAKMANCNISVSCLYNGDIFFLNPKCGLSHHLRWIVSVIFVRDLKSSVMCFHRNEMKVVYCWTIFTNKLALRTIAQLSQTLECAFGFRCWRASLFDYAKLLLNICIYYESPWNILTFM